MTSAELDSFTPARAAALSLAIPSFPLTPLSIPGLQGRQSSRLCIQGALAHIAPSHQGLHRTGVSSQGGTLLRLLIPMCSPPIIIPHKYGDFTIPNSYGKQPKGLTESRDFSLCGCSRHPASALARTQGQTPRFGWILPVPSRAVCPALATTHWQHARLALLCSPQAWSKRQGSATSKAKGNLNPTCELVDA